MSLTSPVTRMVAGSNPASEEIQSSSVGRACYVAHRLLPRSLFIE